MRLKFAAVPVWQVPSSFAGQFAAVAYLTGLQLGEPVPVDVLISNAGLTMKVRASALQRASPACLFPPAHVCVVAGVAVL
jgi:hypothetical protein